MKYCKGRGQLTLSNRCGDCRYWWCSKCLESHWGNCRKPESVEERDRAEEQRQKGSRHGNLINFQVEGSYKPFLTSKSDVYRWSYPLVKVSYNECLCCGEEMGEDQEWEWCHGKCKDLVHQDCIAKSKAKKKKCYLCKDPTQRHHLCRKCHS